MLERVNGQGVRGFRILAPLAMVLCSAGCVPGAEGGAEGDNRHGAGFAGPSRPVGPPPEFGQVERALEAPPPIIGGTLLLLGDDRTAVASDPDRDRIFVSDYRKSIVLADLPLQKGDEPGRVIEDGEGRVHVALRRGGALVTLTREPWQVAARRPICAAPRGLAWDARQRLIHVACADGELVSLAPEPERTDPTRRVALASDLRDVVMDGEHLIISRFRSAEVLTVDPAGKVIGRRAPPVRMTQQFVQRGNDTLQEQTSMSASVGWRLVPWRQGQALMLHQRGLDGEIGVEQPGGYASAGSCGGILETTVSAVGPGATPVAASALSMATVTVDLAVSPDGKRVAVVSPGNHRIKAQHVPQVHLFGSDEVGRESDNCKHGGPVNRVGVDGGRAMGTGGAGNASGAAGAGGAGGDTGPETDELPPPTVAYNQPNGEATAIAFNRKGHLIVQTREPATIQLLTANRLPVLLSRESRQDTGHSIFHANSGGALACASCHPEGGEDGRVWRFRGKDQKVEVRRTQSLRGGIMQTLPFHWNGDLPDLKALMSEVFVQRMSGPQLQGPQVEALNGWMDTIPALPRLPVRDTAAVERGRAVFHSAVAACATCHLGGVLTNNKTVDVGTGKALQVPSLRGVAWRAPFMHDGCAATLQERFAGKCGGGDKHGVVSKLGAPQVADLVSYMESL